MIALRGAAKIASELLVDRGEGSEEGLPVRYKILKYGYREFIEKVRHLAYVQAAIGMLRSLCYLRRALVERQAGLTGER
jgi:hypothetical protein